ARARCAVRGRDQHGPRAVDGWLRCTRPAAIQEHARMNIRVLLVDDENLVRVGFRLILESERDIDVVGEATNGVEAVEATKKLDPDVILMDVQMPIQDGLAATREISALGRPSSSRVIILTTFDLDEYVYEALRA